MLAGYWQDILLSVRATVQAVIDAPPPRVAANGYRITTDHGDELFGSAQRRFWQQH
jgi:hypothetical protein